jgi:hypothetical protein
LSQYSPAQSVAFGAILPPFSKVRAERRMPRKPLPILILQRFAGFPTTVVAMYTKWAGIEARSGWNFRLDPNPQVLKSMAREGPPIFDLPRSEKLHSL